MPSNKIDTAPYNVYLVAHNREGQLIAKVLFGVFHGSVNTEKQAERINSVIDNSNVGGIPGSFRSVIRSLELWYLGHNATFVFLKELA